MAQCGWVLGVFVQPALNMMQMSDRIYENLWITRAPGNGKTYPQVYDALGRYVFFNATLDF